MSTIRTALEAAREYLSDERDGCLATGTYPDGRLDPGEQEHVDQLESLLAQIDAALAEQQQPGPVDWSVAERGIAGGKITFSIGSQTFALLYEPDDDEDRAQMAGNLRHALARLSTLTPAVKTAGTITAEQYMEACRKMHLPPSQWESFLVAPAIRALQDQAPQPAEQWIPVSKRLPANPGLVDDAPRFVLAYSEHSDWAGSQIIVIRADEFYTPDDAECPSEPSGTSDARAATHWMPLPQPPVTQENEQ